MKETFYFSHDYNARNDEKIVKLIQKEGLEGYGIFWCLVEKLYENGGWIEEDYDCIAFDMRTDSERIERVVKHYNLFDVASKRISSKSVLARLRKRKGKSEKARQSAKVRWNKQRKNDANALRTDSERNAIKESKVKNSKVKEIYSEQSSLVTMRDVELSNLLSDLIYENLPTFKKPNIDKWAEHLSRMRRLDDRTDEQVECVIRWCQKDPFWQANILSTKKLREKFDQLVGQIKRKKVANKPKGLSIGSITK